MNWQNKIKAFLHDPPDKALKIAGHEGRRDSLLEVLNLKFDISPEFDQIASSMERIVPETGVLIDFSRTDRNFHPILHHPIIGKDGKKHFKLTSESVLGLKKSRIENILIEFLDKEKDILKRLKSREDKITYFRIWRFMKELIERELGKELANLPADTRCPDHTIWDHLDASSAIYGVMSRTPALLMFKLTPVQDFIKNARKERDLWAGSHLLSYLTFKAIEVVVEKYGPDAVIFPHLRGQPFFDFEYLNYFGDFIDRENLKTKLDVANIPNKFLAIVDFKSVDDLKCEIRKAIDETLEDLFKFSVKEAFGSVSDHVINYSLKILQNYFNVTVCAIPADLEKLIEILKNLPSSVREKYEKWIELIKTLGYKLRIFDLYSLMFEFLEEIVAIESRKFEKSEGLGKPKCSLCGELEIFGSKETWKNADVKLFKENEILCPVCLVKRVYSDWFKERTEKKGIARIDVGFESVSEVALRKVSRRVLKDHSKKLTFYDIIEDTKLAREVKCETLVKTFYDNVSEILDKLDMPFNYELAYTENLRDVESVSKTLGVEKNMIANIRNVEKYLENARKAIEELEERIGKLPRYYAILMMDGDNMGRMLVGDDMKTVDNYLHPKVVAQLPDKLKDKVKDVKRLITPATHSAISRALAHFSINVVPSIVEKHRGELIYAGGDDVLALLPIDSALACAYRIWREFGKDWDGWNLLPAKKMSAGILIVHYKHPLYDALDKVRELEKKAKSLGRNAVAVGYLTRGGSYYEVVFNWSMVPKLGEFVDLLLSEERPRISKRIIYDVIENAENLPNDQNAIEAYLKFEFMRHYEGDGKAEDLARKAIDLARGIRVTLSSSDLEELKVDLSRVKLSRLNEKINEQISNGFSIDAIKNVLSKLSIEYNAEELYGLILKKQVKGLFVLFKILRDCESDLGDVHED